MGTEGDTQTVAGALVGQMLAVVTGASSGIGYELAKELGRRGYDLIVRRSMPQQRHLFFLSPTAFATS